MLFVAMALLLALMAMFFGYFEERQHNPNQLPASTQQENYIEVTLERNRAGHYITTGSINNHAVEFLLDTGATDVVIPMVVAQRLGLEAGKKSQAMTANGLVVVYATRISELRIGQIHLTDVRASINPAMHSEGILLGMSALKKVEFSQQGNLLTLKQTF